MPTSQQVRAAIARHAYRRPDDAEGEQTLRRQLAKAKISEYVQRVVAESPPLSAEDKAEIAALLARSEAA